MRTHFFASMAALLGLALSAAGQGGQGAAAAGQADRSDRYTLVRCGTLLAVSGQEPRKEVTVVVKNDKTYTLVPGFTGPDLKVGKKAGAEAREGLASHLEKRKPVFPQDCPL